MPRDVLLALVLVAVLLNLALLVAVGISRWHQAGSPARPTRQIRRNVQPAAPPREAFVPRRGAGSRPVPWSSIGVRDVPALAARERKRPIEAPLAAAPPDAPAASYVPPGTTIATPAGPDTPLLTVTLDRPSEADGQAPADELSATKAAPDPLPVEPATRRGRRFVLPRNDEDKGRTERAIEAFLGEPAPSGSTSTHRPRRRARRRGTPGEGGEPLVLVAALGGFEQLRQTVGREGAVRFAEAYGEALRATMRSGDHLTDLGQGRLRLVVHADEEGARALMDRARGVCEPWLRLAPVPLALRVRPMPDPRSGNGHRPDGHPERRQPEGAAAEAPADGGSASVTSGRPDEADARRFAAG